MESDAGRVALAMAPNLVRALMADFKQTLLPLVYKDVYEFKDISYVPGSNHPKHKLDLFLPSKPFPRPRQPVLLFVHGGAWQRGDRRHYMNLYWNVGVAAATHGCVGVVPSYRLSPEVRHPTHVQDLAAALAWTHANIHRYGGDRDNIFVCGHSAGAHLAFLLGLQPHWARQAAARLREHQQHQHPHHQQVNPSSHHAHPPHKSMIRGLIGLAGVYNLPRLATSPLGHYLVDPPFGGGGGVSGSHDGSEQHSTSGQDGQAAEPQHGDGQASDHHLRAASPVHIASSMAIAARHSQHSQLHQHQHHLHGTASPSSTSAASSIISGRVPVLMANAGEDFHLEHDTDEMDMALALAHAQGGQETGSRHNISGSSSSRPQIREAIAASAASTPVSVLPQSGAAASFDVAGPVTASAATTAAASPPSPSVRWMKHCHAPFVSRAIIPGSNHMTVVGGIGQPGDATTEMIFDFVKRNAVPALR